MKKVLTILVVLALVAGFAFATDPVPTIGNPGTVTLTSTVVGIAPVFVINHSDDLVNVNKKVGNIAAGDITATFIISQKNDINYTGDAKGYSNYGDATETGTGVTLTVTCGPFKNGTVTSDKAVTVTGAEYATVISANTDKLTLAAAGPTYDNNEATFVPTYHGKRVDNQDIGTLTAKWTKDSDLPLGTYVADIVLTYTAN